MSAIRIALVDDDRLMVDLLSEYLSTTAGFEVCIKAYNGLELLDQLKATTPLPAVAIVDLRMAEMNGIDTIDALKSTWPSIKVVAVSSYYQTSFVGFLLKTGADAFLPKGLTPQELATAIEEVHCKGHYFLPDQLPMLKNQLGSNLPEPKLQAHALLSDREKEVLLLLCQQCTAKEIGEQLFISTRTVEGHKNKLLQKTGARNTVGLALYALQHHFLKADELFLP